MGIFDAAEGFGGRLPELFCGFDRDRVRRAGALSDVLLAAGLGGGGARSTCCGRCCGSTRGCRSGGCGATPPSRRRFLPLRIESLHVAGARVSVDVTEDGWSMDGLGEILELVRSGRDPLTAISH